MDAEELGVAPEPFAETSRRGGRGGGDEQIRHQAAHFVASEGDVTHRAADDPRAGERDGGRNVDHRGVAADLASDQGDEFIEGEGLGADGVDGKVIGSSAGVEDKFGEILDEHRLHPIIAVTGDRKERNPAQHPGDIIEQNFLGAEDHGRANDRVRESGAREVVLDDALAAKVRQRRGGIRVGDADVDEAAHAGVLGGVDQGAEVADRAIEIEAVMGEANPPGVEDDRGAVEAAREVIGAIEVEGRDFELAGDGVVNASVIGERAHTAAIGDQLAGNIAAGVTEGPGDEVELSGHGWDSNKSRRGRERSTRSEARTAPKFIRLQKNGNGEMRSRRAVGKERDLSNSRGFSGSFYFLGRDVIHLLFCVKPQQPDCAFVLMPLIDQAESAPFTSSNISICNSKFEDLMSPSRDGHAAGRIGTDLVYQNVNKSLGNGTISAEILDIPCK
jgi:hypothetical protein